MGKLLTERFAFGGGRVDREAGTIGECVISGPVSANGRDYPPDVYRRDFAKYEGAPSNCDHGKDDTIDRRLGWFEGVTVGTDGKPRGTFHLLKSHPMYERVMEAAERNPRMYGFSHVIEAKTSRKAGREIVESIERVISIDLVATPATTKSLFEGAAVGITVKALCEALVRHPKTTARAVAPLKQLAEMDGMGDALSTMDAPPADDADPADGVKDAFAQAVMHLAQQALDGEIDSKTFAKMVKKLVDSHADIAGAGDSDGDGDTDSADADTGGDEMPSESNRVKPEDVLAECKAAGFAPTYEQGEHLRNIANADTRKLVIESFKAAVKVTEAERPVSRCRTEVRTESKDAGAEPTVESIRKGWHS